MGSTPRDEFYLITCMLKHLQRRVQMFAICFKMHQKNVKALMDGRGVGIAGPPPSTTLMPGCGWWATGSSLWNSSGFAVRVRMLTKCWGQSSGPERAPERKPVARLCSACSSVQPGPGLPCIRSPLDCTSGASCGPFAVTVSNVAHQKHKCGKACLLSSR